MFVKNLATPLQVIYGKKGEARKGKRFSQEKKKEKTVCFINAARNV